MNRVTVYLKKKLERNPTEDEINVAMAALKKRNIKRFMDDPDCVKFLQMVSSDADELTK